MYLLLKKWLFSFMFLMVIVLRRCISSSVSNKLAFALGPEPKATAYKCDCQSSGTSDVARTFLLA